jgi:hypothetical protein
VAAEITDPQDNSSIVTSAQTIAVSEPRISLSAQAGQKSLGTVASGKSTLISLLITNTGNISAIGKLTITITAADPATGQSQITFATWARPATIAADATHRYRLRIQIPKTASTGVVYPAVHVSLAGASANISDAGDLTIV